MTHMVQSSRYFTNFSDRDIYLAIDPTKFAEGLADSTYHYRVVDGVVYSLYLKWPSSSWIAILVQSTLV